MTEGYTCDRCGEFVAELGDKEDGRKKRQIVFQVRSHVGNARHRSCARFDLCLDCREELKEFVKDHEVEP